MAGNATGERLDGATVQAIINAAASGAANVNQIVVATGVSAPSVQAILDREAQAIAERTKELKPILVRIAKRAFERIEREIENPKLSLPQVAMTAGISTDKLLAISASEQAAPASQHLHVHLQSTDIARQFNAFVESLQSPTNDVERAPSLVVSRPPRQLPESSTPK